MSHAIGVVGLGVMGRNLARNIAGHGFSVAGYDLDAAKARSLAELPEADRIEGVATPDRLMQVLERPRCVLVMVPAGKPVDDVVSHLAGHMTAGDILIDGGNSFFLDTERRCREAEVAGLQFVGCGVSGGEDGALHGPSLMPGGPRAAWDALAPVLSAIAAKATEDGLPCVAYMGPRAAGHYVKMVHNGIEYGDMQLIAEVYDLLGRGLGLPASELASLFAEWNRGELRSYLIEITSRILGYTDSSTGRPLVDLILDEAQQKGTGKWASQNAFDVGAAIPTINAAVEARIVSALKAERVAASKVLRGPAVSFDGDRGKLVDAARQALYASKVTSYAQGLALLRLASKEYGYALDPGEIARIWRAGCIIRARLLGEIRDAYRRDPGLVNLLLDDAFRAAVEERQGAWRFVVQTAVGLGIPVPALSASLAWYDAYRSERLPANLTQAQRDYFGAHTYRRVDREGSFHTEWPGAR
ncbi:MAG TPA: NADP-dependent phosphogluconate dehydrogenase [Vicinamibacteria bacterium]|nr:NADP-dependent phosphogluconate dehydrogenase [Vicinamibacteria bacterium]